MMTMVCTVTCRVFNEASSCVESMLSECSEDDMQLLEDRGILSILRMCGAAINYVCVEHTDGNYN